MVFCTIVVLSNSLSSQIFPPPVSINKSKTWMFLHVFAPSWWDKSMSWVIQKSLETANLKLKTPVGPLHAEMSWAELANNDESFLPRATKCEHSLTHLFPRQKHGNNKTKNQTLEWYNLIFPRHTHSKQNSTRTLEAQGKNKKKEKNSKSQRKSRVKERKKDHLDCRSSNTHYHHCSR